MGDFKEARVDINERRLSSAEVVTLRVAVSGMLMDLADDEHMAALGEIGPLYQKHLCTIEKLLVRGGQ